jgi:serine/threonine protein kinase/Tol biopolymer transport system component
MPISPGDRLGHYEILSLLGKGGMGEVYRARDTTLKRDVALKILPAAFLRDPERMARFQREAEVLASLDHPNIGPIFGLVDSPDSRALVLALIEGPTLADRIEAGALPQDEALAIAKQIIEALEYAHDRGVVHRDLKPANVKITPEGVVKVLDFGLAKVLLEGEDAEPPASSLANSPTLTLGHTRAGMILGTAAYMSPEQAVGRPVDRRSDIFSFGALLYEMLTGKRAFTGATAPDVLEAVVKTDPDWSQLPAHEALVRRCLTKDRKERLQAIGEARIVLAIPPPNRDRREADAPVTAHSRSWFKSAMPWAAAAVLAITTALALWNRPTPVQKTAARLTIPLPAGQEITSYPAITPDGRTIAYIAQQGADASQLYLRDLNSFESRAVAGSSGAVQPFFSPDGKWVAYFAQGQLQRAEVTGGAPIKLAEAPYPFGGTWNEDNTIIYAASLGSGLLRIPASGGTPESLTKPDGAGKGYAHVFPQALPGGQKVLFNTWGQTQGNAVLSLDSPSHPWETVLPSPSFAVGIFDPAGGSSGRLLVVDQSSGMMAAPFDAAHPARTSADTTVLTGVYYDVENEARGWLAVSNNRTAVYATGNPAKTSLVWVDREGKIESLGNDQDLYREASLSPDGSKAVVRHVLNLWIHDLQRGTRTPITSGNAGNNRILWSRDGTRIIFASNRGGDWDIYSQPADGSGPAEALLKRPYDQFPASISADRTLIYNEINPKTGVDLWTLSADGQVSPLRVTPFNERDGEFSPTGGWVAYTSDESGRSEVYVQRHPGGANRIPVSNGGGIQPRWSRDGKELFYATGDAVVAVAFHPDGSFGVSHRLFDRANFFMNPKFHTYDVSPDGKRFLMIRRDEGSVPRQLNVILNWSDPAPK